MGCSYHLALSPDGKWIACVLPDRPCNPNGWGDVCSLAVVNLDGSSWRSLVQSANIVFLPKGTQVPEPGSTPRGMIESLTWSPDGRRILFSAGGTLRQTDQTGSYIAAAKVPYEIWMCDVASGATQSVDRGTSPVWFPDGLRMAFAGADGQIYIRSISLPGQNPATAYAVYRPDSTVRGIQLAPDGKRILVTCDNGGLWLVDLVCASDQAVCHCESPRRLSTNGGYAGTWSPDGQRIAFIRDSKAVCVLDDDGTNERTILAATRWPKTPSWASWVTGIAWAGKATLELLVSSFEGVYSVNVETGKVTLRLRY